MTIKSIEHRVSTRIPTSVGEFTLHLYRELGSDKEQLAFTYGNWQPGESVLVRMHSECFTGDVLGSRRCDCGEQLKAAIYEISRVGKGALIYLRQEGRGIGLEEKLKAYNLQDQGLDTVDANLALGHSADSRDYGVGAAILKDLGIDSLFLLTNNPAKMNGLEDYGIRVEQRVPLEMEIHDHNKEYLQTKVLKMNHIIDLHHIVA